MLTANPKSGLAKDAYRCADGVVSTFASWRGFAPKWLARGSMRAASILSGTTKPLTARALNAGIVALADLIDPQIDDAHRLVSNEEAEPTDPSNVVSFMARRGPTEG
jgi:hypothetical protein